MNLKKIIFLLKEYNKESKYRRKNGYETWFSDYKNNYFSTKYNETYEKNKNKITTLREIPLFIYAGLFVFTEFVAQKIFTGIPFDCSFFGLLPLIVFIAVTLYSIKKCIHIRNNLFDDKTITIKDKYILTILGINFFIAILSWSLGIFSSGECMVLMIPIDSLQKQIIQGLPLKKAILSWEDYVFEKMNAHEKIEYKE